MSAGTLVVAAAASVSFAWLAWRFRVLSDGYAEIFDRLLAARGTIARHRAVAAMRRARIDADVATIDEMRATITAQQFLIGHLGEALDDAIEDNEVLTRALGHALGAAERRVPAPALGIVR